MSFFDHDDNDAARERRERNERALRSNGGMLGARYGGAPRVESPRVEQPAPKTPALNWREWRGEDTYGYALSLSESGDGDRVHLKCIDAEGRGGVLCPRVGKPHDPPPGVALVSYGGGFLDPQQARELAAALIAYADEKDGGR